MTPVQEGGERLGSLRRELADIGAELEAIAADRRPIPAVRVGDLLARLARLFGRIMNARGV